MEEKSKKLLIELLEAVAAADPERAQDRVFFSGPNSLNQYDIIQQVKDEVDCGISLMGFLEAQAKSQNLPLDDYMRSIVRPYDPAAAAAAEKEAEQQKKQPVPKRASPGF